jgi:hypothetical protein
MHSGMSLARSMTVCCSPLLTVLLQVRKQWDEAYLTVGSCIVAVPFYTSMASITIVFDVIMYVSSPPFPASNPHR